MKRFRLLTVCADDSDATSFYRGLGPISALERATEWLDVRVMWHAFDYSENRLRLMDGLFIQRPSADFHLNLIKTAKMAGVPVWADLDDNVFAIPEDNPYKGAYDRQNYPFYTAECLKLADVITVTTGALAEVVKGISKADVRVIPNAFDDRFLHLKNAYKRSPEKKPCILWRGAQGHDQDLFEIAGSIRAAHEAHPEWKWIFMGQKPWMITRELPAEVCLHVDWVQSVSEYLKTLNKFQPNLVIVPLADHAFNRSKSNNAWIEASFSNAATLCADWPEWAREGAINYQDKKSFAEKLHMLMGWHETALGGAALRSWQFIEKNLLLSRVNAGRLEILESWRR